MRAWLLLLAVLATFQPIVQVASTEDISSRFITAISPQRSTESISTINTKKTTTTTTNTKATTALSRASIPVIDSSVSSSDSSSSTSTSAAASSFLYANSDSDNIIKNNSEQANNNNLDNNVIIEIMNIDEFEGNTVNKELTEHKVPETGRTDQLENSKNNQITNTIVNGSAHIETVEHLKKKSHEMAVNESENTSSAVQHKKHHHQHQHHHHHQRHHQQHHQKQHHHTQHTTTDTSRATIANSSSLHTTADHRVKDLPESHSKDDSNSSDDVEDEEEEAPTFSSKKIISESIKQDPSTLVHIENSFLSLFNMKKRPKIDRSKIFIPEVMKQLYTQITGHDLDSDHIPRRGILTKSANTVRSFEHLDSKIDDRFPHHHRFRLHFDIKSIPAEDKLKAAELQLARDAISHAALNPRLAKRTRYQVLVYDITRVGIRGKREPSYLLLDNKTIRLNSTETVSMDVQPAVDRWLETPEKNFGLLVEVRTMRALQPAPHHHVRLRRSADEPDDSWKQKQPLLITYTDDGQTKSRSIRDVSNRSKRRPHRRKNSEVICRQHALWVEFSEVGWDDWIVAPTGYNAGLCHGKCPFPLAEHLNSTNHAVVQTLVNNVNPAKAPMACCVPTQLEPITMLILNDQNTVVLKNYQDMAVVGCGCR